MGRAKPASGRGTNHNKNQWTLIMDYLWKGEKTERDPKDTNGQRRSRGLGQGERGGGGQSHRRSRGAAESAKTNVGNIIVSYVSVQFMLLFEYTVVIF